MNQITAPSTTTPTAGSQVAAITGVIVQLPPNVSRSNLAMLLTGTVVGRDAQGLILVQSDQGLLGLRLSAQPPTGAALTLQVQSAGAQLHVAVVASNPARASAPTAAPAPPIEATYLGPQTGDADAPEAPPPRGTSSPPATYAVRVLPGTAASTPTSMQLAAVVAGRAANGQTLVDTPAGRFSLPLANQPPPGTRLVLQSTATTLPTAPSQAAAESRGGNVMTTAVVTPPQASAPSSAQPIAPRTNVATVVITQAAAPAETAPSPMNPASVVGRPVATTAMPAMQAATNNVPAAQPESAGEPSGRGPPLAPRPATVPPAATVAISSAPPFAAAAQVTSAASVAPPAPRPVVAVAPPPPAAEAIGGSAAPPQPPGPSAPILRATLLPMAAARATPAAALPISVRVTPIDVEGPKAPHSVAPSSPSLPPPQGPKGERIFTGIVAGQAPTGETIVESGLGRVTVALPKPPPAGQTLVLQLMAEARPPAAPTSTTSAHALTALSREWPTLKAALAAHDPAAAAGARTSVEAVLPQPGPKLAQQILAFFSALDSGDARGWLGEAGQSLERATGAGLLASIEADLAEMKPATAGNGDWRVAFLPFLDGAELQQIRIYSRRHKPGAKSEADPGDRFILDFDLTELGPLQIDGLLHKPRCDVILRSQALLPDWLREELVRLYADSISAIGFSGELSFQVARSFPSPPLDDAPAEGRGVVV